MSLQITYDHYYFCSIGSLTNACKKKEKCLYIYVDPTKCYYPNRMGSEISDDTIESLAYEVCNTDGVDGLSWSEVDLCEVSKYKYGDIRLEYLKRVSCFEGT